MKSSFTKFSVFVLLLMLAIGVIGVWFWRSLSHLPKEIRHVLLISIDTCRADYLSCYGYRRQTTPNIDKFAEESILFTNVISPVPLTLPAHCSMLTGSIPPYHGIHDNFDYRLDESNVTLAKILKEAGFTTGAIISAFVLDSQFGLDQGFDTYNDHFEEEHMAQNISERKGGEASRFALKWLDQHKDEKFFLFLHYFDPHSGYEPPEPFATEFSDSPYAGEIAYTDDCIGLVIKKLKDLGLYDSSLIIITGDHGEMLGEHGENTHMYFIYQSAIKVPLIFKLPGRGKGERIDDPVGIIDIVPTICSALGIAIPSGVQGKALFGPSRAGKDRYIYCESLAATKYGGNSLLGVTSNNFKYIQTTRPELYDLAEDPREMNNLVANQPHRARILQDRLKQILEQSVRKDDSEGKMELDEEAIKRLESLGYVGGSVTEDFDFDQSKDDPKDLIDFHQRLAKAHELIRRKQYKEAEQLCESLLLERPDVYEIFLSLAQITMEQDNYAEGVVHLKKAIQLEPNKTLPHIKLGQALLELGETDEAIKQFEEVLRISPEKPWAHDTLGVALIKQKKYDLAITHFQKELEVNPQTAEVHKNLGSAFFTLRQFDKALEHYNKSLELDPKQAFVLRRIGQLYRRLGNIGQALDYLRRASQLEPDWPVPMIAQAWILATSTDAAFRNPQEAVRLAEQACELTNYTYPAYVDTLAIAYAAAGRFSEAVQTSEKALSLAGSAEEQKGLAAEIQKHLELFKAGQPYLELPQSKDSADK